MSEQVTAQVTLRAKGGSSVLEADEPITADNVHKYQAGKETIQEATRKLSAYGFEVGAAGPQGLSISGDKALFERVFHTRLEAQKTSGGAESLAGTGIYFQAAEPMDIPDDLSSVVAGVTLPTPPQLFP